MVSKTTLLDLYDKKVKELDRENNKRLKAASSLESEYGMLKHYESYAQYYSELIAYDKEIGLHESIPEIYYRHIKELAYFQKKIDKELNRNQAKQKKN